MDVAIINPRVTSLDRERYGSVLEASLDMPPLGVLYLATVLIKEGYEVKVYDLNSVRFSAKRKEIIESLLTKTPKVIAISTLTPCFPEAVEIMKSIRKTLNNSCKIILGGYHATFLPDLPLIENWADVVVRGEGEYILLDLIRIFIEGSKSLKLDNIESISYWKNGTIAHNPPHLARINNLDQVPFPNRSLIDIKKYNVPGTIMGSRGCIGKCKFCSATAWGTFRDRSAENVMEELKYLTEKLDIKHLCYIDNIFSVNQKKIMELFHSIEANNIDCTFSMETRVNNMNDDLLEIFKLNKVISIQYGVESGDPRVLADINKGISIERVLSTVEKSLSVGMNVMCTFIIGHPTDTEDSVANTITFAKRLKKMGVQTKFEVLTPYPGTEFFNNRDKYGITITDWNFSKWGTTQAVYETKYLSNKKINRLFTNAIWEVNTI